MSTISELQDYLRIGLSVARELWSYKTKGWVMSIQAADIDSDGDIEIVGGSKDGRVYVITKDGDERWKYVVGKKAPLETVAAISPVKGRDNVCLDENAACARVLVGKRDGKMYAFDKDGKEVAPNRQTDSLDDKSWYSSPHVLRNVFVNLEQSNNIFIGSEDRCIRAIDYYTGEQRWVFETQGWVRAIALCQNTTSGKSCVLVGSDDKYLYKLDEDGKCIQKKDMHSQIHALFVLDIDRDKQEEILLITDGKDLVVLTTDLQEKWTTHFPNRLLAMHAADLDNDGYTEIIVSSEDKYLYFFDHEGKKIWRHATDYRIFSLYAVDANKDGLVEVFAGAEERICAFQFTIIKHLEDTIRKIYQKTKRKDLNYINELLLPESILLHNIISIESRNTITLKNAIHHVKRQEHIVALLLLLQLQQHKFQVFWHKDIYKGQETRGHVRALCHGDISGDSKLEIIVGTDDGSIHAFTAHGKLLWSKQLTGQIASMHTGYLYHGQWQEIVVCSTNDRLYVISASTIQKTNTPEIKAERVIEWVTSHYVNSKERYQPFEILVGTEDKKIYVWKENIDTFPDKPIDTEQGIKILCLYEPHHADDPEIIAGSNEDRVYAYTRGGKLLWQYRTRDRIQAICVKDIDGDGQAEILIGSEDRNIHVINGRGQLKWRYYLPHRVLSIDCAQNKHGDYEVFVGCGDEYMYVFNKDGDLLWKYQAQDLIRVVRVGDINKDGKMEITLGSEDHLEVLQIVDQEEVQNHIDECWQAIQSHYGKDEAIHRLRRESHPLLRTFALQRQLEHTYDDQTALVLLKEMLPDTAIEVRKVLIQEVMSRYASFPEKACSLLDQIAAIPQQEVRLAFVEALDVLIAQAPETGFKYLTNMVGNADRFVRRAVIRKVHQLIGDKEIDRKVVFDILLLLVKDKDSEWLRQESARTLAHLFDKHQESILIYIYKLIIKGIGLDIFRHICFNARENLVQKSIETLLTLLDKEDKNTVVEKLERVVPVLAGLRQLKNGEDTWLIYKEMHHLFNYRTLEAIAQYQCTLPSKPFTETNKHFIIVTQIFHRLNIICRSLQLYIRRDEINDRFRALIDAMDAIDLVNRFLEKLYLQELSGDDTDKLPDRELFLQLLQHWRLLVQTQLNKLKGSAELVAELQTKIMRQEEQVVVWLFVHNRGRGSATNIRITLLHSNQFELIGNQTHETDVVFTKETIQAEFTIIPHTTSLDLIFEISYDESTGTLTEEGKMRVMTFGDRLELQNTQRVFRYIHNPYTPGIPSENSVMCYGRDTEIAFLKDNLTRITAKTVLVLYGQRRSGKTTLLLQLVNTPVMEGHIPVFFNMQEVSYKISDSKLFHKLALLLFKALEKRTIFVKRPSLQDFESDPTFAFSVFLDELEPRLRGQKVIFLIDEFEVLEEQVKKGRLDPEIFEYLRSLMQHRSYINVLLSGTHQIKQLTQEYWSVFFNTALHYRLKKLSEKGACDLIQMPVKEFLEYEAHAAIKIRQLTGDQPYLIQLLCRALVDHCNEVQKNYVTVNDINSVLHEVMQTGDIHFGWLWNQLSSREQTALAALAEGSKDEGRPLSFVDIQGLYTRYQLPYKHEDIQMALRSLSDADIIERCADDNHYDPATSSRFRIPVGLMRLWLRKEKPLATILELSEQ